MHSFKNERNAKIANNLKLGCLKLGKTMLFITASDKTRKVFMLSADSKITPTFEDNYIFYTYKEDILTGKVYGSEGLSHKKYIMNALESYLEDTDLLNVKN